MKHLSLYPLILKQQKKLAFVLNPLAILFITAEEPKIQGNHIKKNTGLFLLDYLP